MGCERWMPTNTNSDFLLLRLERVRTEMFSPGSLLSNTLDRAEELLKAKDYLEALLALNEAEEIATNVLDGEVPQKEQCRALRLRVKVSGRLKDHEGALEAAVQLAALSDNSAQGLQLLGAALFGVGRVEEASETFREALAVIDGAQAEGDAESEQVRQLVEKGISRCLPSEHYDLHSCIGSTNQLLPVKKS